MDVLALAMAKKYTDSQRLAYEGISQTELLPQTTFDAVYDEYAGMHYAHIETTSVFNLGEVINIVFDGIQYERTCVDVDGSLYFGNMSIMGGTDTGEPFCICCPPDGTILVVCGEGTHTISMSKVETVLKTIDPKFLPSGYGASPIFDLYTEGVETNLYVYRTPDCSDSTNRVTAEELKTAINNGCVLRVVSAMPDTGEIKAIINPIGMSVADGMGIIICAMTNAVGNIGVMPLYTAEYTGQ